MFFSSMIIFSDSFGKSYHKQNFNYSLKVSVFEVKGSAGCFRNIGTAVLPERRTPQEDMGRGWGSLVSL